MIYADLCSCSSLTLQWAAELRDPTKGKDFTSARDKATGPMPYLKQNVLSYFKEFLKMICQHMHLSLEKDQGGLGAVKQQGLCVEQKELLTPKQPSKGSFILIGFSQPDVGIALRCWVKLRICRLTWVSAWG